MSSNSVELTVAAEKVGSIFSVGSAAQALLRRTSYSALREVTCDYHEGVLTLRGRVPTYFLKQLAQVIVSNVEGVEEIANHLVVVDPDIESISSVPNLMD